MVTKKERTRMPAIGAPKPADLYSTRREIDYILLGATLILVGIGLVMVFSASYYSAMHSGNIYSYFSTQALGAVLGLLAIYLFSTLTNYKLVSKFSKIFYLISCALLVYVRLFGREINGAFRWIDIGPAGSAWFTFQPSELMKVAVIVMLAVYINNNKERVFTFKGLAGYFLLAFIPMLLVLWGRNLSTAIIILAIAFVIYFLASPYFWRFIIFAAIPIGFIWAVLTFNLERVFFGDVRGLRLETWQDPFLDPQGAGFQSIQSLFAVASGGLFGRGLGNSMQKMYYLPESQNDFIFAIIVEELGLFGGLIILGLFGVIVWRGIRAAINARDKLSLLIATGITTMIAVQVIINVGVVTNTLPNTGIPMPFISYGGTSIAVTMAAVGLLLNITRYPKEN
ncbi:MAG: putative lipid II flippase FtsW [Defluviitaleaceae bacterium]|nr:putative lipid II flippase FtsW [Defluviitaleaceae bacterium]